MREAVERIRQDWMNEHGAHAADYGNEPWGIQWGGPQHVQFVADLVGGVVRNKHVVEIGVGGGKFTKMLYEIGALTVIGLDVHQVSIVQASLYEDRATYILSKGDEIPLPDQSTDVVFTYDVLLHLPPELVVRYLQEGFRVGWEMIVQLPVLDYPASREWYLRRVRDRVYENPYELGYFCFYTNDMVKQMIELAGWKPTMLGHNQRDSVWLCQK